jgi:NADPH:quinone reductase-like Zn-dependent oxidoreductase
VINFFENLGRDSFSDDAPLTIQLHNILLKALIFNQLNTFPAYSDWQLEPPDEKQVQVTLQAAALNHRDLFITQGLYAGIQMPCILGSDGAGVVGNRKVVLYPALEWGHTEKHQGKSFRVLGMPDHGTFAETIRLPSENLFDMPNHLSPEEAAALPLAGLTAWRTLFSRCQLASGERVLITGIGGGVALMAMQLALAAGAEVFVSSGNQEKIQKAIAMGASGGANYREENWDKQLKAQAGGFDVIIDSAGGDSFTLLPSLCNPGGRIGFYGGTLGKVTGLSLQPLFWKQISLFGSTMGSPLEFAAMLAFVQRHQIRPVVDSVYALKDGAKAFERMKSGLQFGKLVLKITA